MENSIENIRRSKQTISEIVITTVIISIGINFVVLGISKELDFNNNLMLIIIGSIFIILSLLIISFQKFKQSNRNVIIEAALEYDNANRERFATKAVTLKVLLSDFVSKKHPKMCIGNSNK